MKTPAAMCLLLVTMGLMAALQAQSHPITRRDLFSREMPLDMALASFDDQYAGCATAMTAALPDLNRTEFQANRVYADGWAQASSQWQERQAWGPGWGGSPSRLPPPPGFREEHGVALLAYTANSPLHKEFNAAVREAGRSRAHYLHHFSFKTLHFLLTEALQLLSSGQRPPQCHQVFRGVQGLRFRPAGPGATVRLGGFASASLQNAAAQQFGEDTFFGIWTCLGAPIKGYSFFPGEEEVLIPPFETFQVINASRPAQGPARIYLRALGKRSTYNCEYIKGPSFHNESQAAGWNRGPHLKRKKVRCGFRAYLPWNISSTHKLVEDKQCKSRPCRLDNSAMGRGPTSALWSLLLLLWFLVGGDFPESPGLL